MNRGKGARSNGWTLQYKAGDLTCDGMVVRLDAYVTDVKVKWRAALWSFDTPARICPRSFLDLFSICRDER